MKKLTSILLAAIMLISVFCLASCNGAENDASQPDNSSSDEKPVVKMATNAQFQPYEYYDNDVMVGIDVEIAKAVCEKLGFELVIEDMKFDSIITSVQSGACDFGMAGLTVSDERREKVNFTVSYAKGVQVIIVPEDSPITSANDLFADGASYKAGTQFGTTGYIYASDELGEDNAIGYDDVNAAIMAMKGGAVDCVIIDSEPAKAAVAANEGLKILETAYADEDYAICVAKENSELLDKLNSAITELIADGTVDKIVAKYIK